MLDIQKNILELKQILKTYESRYNRPAHSVTLLAASKTRSVDEIEQAIFAGQTIFGENYLQEALKKMEALSQHSLEWHFIGSIQANKIKKIARCFSWVDSVSDKRIAQGLHDFRPMQSSPLNICLEVNISHERSKSGVNPENVLELAEFCRTLPNLTLRGLMSIPAEKTSFAEQRTQLKTLKDIFNSLNEKGFELDTLSMGMSHDMEAAVAEDSTVVRIGTAIFGKRP